MVSEKQVDNIRVHHQIIFLKHPLVPGRKPDDSMPGEAADFLKENGLSCRLLGNKSHYLGFLRTVSK